MVIVPNDSEVLQELAHPLGWSHSGPAGHGLEGGDSGHALRSGGGPQSLSRPLRSHGALAGSRAQAGPGRGGGDGDGGKQPQRSEHSARRDREVTVVSCAFIFGIQGLSANEATGNPRTRQACHYGLVGSNQ